MARYTKTYQDRDFMGWDELSKTAECTEATHEDDLGEHMRPVDIMVFENLGPGETHTSQNGTKFFREW